MKKIYILPFFLFMALILCSCAKHVQKPTVITHQRPADLQNFPQNLFVYAKLDGLNKKLLSTDEQEKFLQKFISIYFGPWEMRKSSVGRNSVSSLFNNARGYKNGTTQWSQSEWNEMKLNANLSRFPSIAIPAITLRNTDLRELPTHEQRFSEPTNDVKLNPFDNFQYSLLPIGTPVLLAHATQDGKWYYVECPIAGGWVDAKDLAFVSQEFMDTWRKYRYAALVRDKVLLPGTGVNGGNSTGSIGTLLPFKGWGKDGIFKVLVPIRAQNSHAKTSEISLSRDAAVIWPMPMTPENVAKVGNAMMGQEYRWGGMLDGRDCSALTRDILTPFGIWLPRNSAAQMKRGTVISLANMTTQEKENVIITEGQPFLSLVGMKGHICLYVGQYKGKPAIFHNVWGVRVVENGNDDARLVIGKAVVTSIDPGKELDNLYRPITFADRVNTLTLLK